MTRAGARLFPAVRLRIFGAALALLAAANAGGEPVNDSVLDAFARIAFGSEYARDADPRLQKWAGPLRWSTYEYAPASSAEREFLERHMARLAQLTGLHVTEAASWREANFLILFVPEESYAAVIERHLAPASRHLLAQFAATACLGLSRHHTATFEIEYAVAIIPVDRARARGLATSCIAEETTQVLGLLNDSGAVPDTLFNDRSSARDLTPLDERMLRLLYDQRLKAGMRREEALRVARAILPSLGAERR